MTRPPHAASSVVGYASDTASAVAKVEPNSNRSRETGRPYCAKTTSFWRNYVKMTLFWRNNDVIIAECVCWVVTAPSIKLHSVVNTSPGDVNDEHMCQHLQKPCIQHVFILVNFYFIYILSELKGSFNESRHAGCRFVVIVGTSGWHCRRL